MTLHSELGASKAERWIECPGSVNAERGLPNTSSPYAVQGTAAHALAERALKKGLDADVWLDTEIDGVTVDEEMVEAVQVYLNYVRKRIKAFPKAVTYIEKQFTLAPLNPPEPMFGTADFVLWDEESGTLEVVDYKHGAGVVVEADGNVQFMYYGLGAVVDLGKKPKTIRVTVAQPRAQHKDGLVRSYEFGWDELVAYKKHLFDAAIKTQDPDAPRKPGAHCRFCKAMPTCPAQRQVAIEVAQSEFDTDGAAVLPAAANLTDDQIGVILLKAPMVEEWLKSIRAYVSDKLDRGESVPGWKLVPKRASRRWKDESAAVTAIVPLIGPDAAYTDPKFKSPAQIEAELKKNKIKFVVDDLVSKESSGTNLVPDTDARPALAPSAQSDFEADLSPELPAPEKPTRKTRAKSA